MGNLCCLCCYSHIGGLASPPPPLEHTTPCSVSTQTPVVLAAREKYRTLSAPALVVTHHEEPSISREPLIHEEEEETSVREERSEDEEGRVSRGQQTSDASSRPSSARSSPIPVTKDQFAQAYLMNKGLRLLGGSLSPKSARKNHRRNLSR